LKNQDPYVLACKYKKAHKIKKRGRHRHFAIERALLQKRSTGETAMEKSVFGHRRSKKNQIADHFRANLSKQQPSPEMHARFGSSFRTRVSDINLDPNSDINIVNFSHFDPATQTEVSVYVAGLLTQTHRSRTRCIAPDHH
jgi:hypothetical protein